MGGSEGKVDLFILFFYSFTRSCLFNVPKCQLTPFLLAQGILSGCGKALGQTRHFSKGFGYFHVFIYHLREAFLDLIAIV